MAEGKRLFRASVLPSTHYYIVAAALIGADGSTHLEIQTNVRLWEEHYISEIVPNFLQILRKWEAPLDSAAAERVKGGGALSVKWVESLVKRCQPSVPSSVSVSMEAENLISGWNESDHDQEEAMDQFLADYDSSG